MARTGRSLQFERMLFFSDAVFAIAITLLVIEIRLPHIESQTPEAMIEALLSLIPNYIGFLISFAVVGRFWIGHHSLFGYIADFDRRVLVRNLIFLGVIAFMPFPTAVLSEHSTSAVTVISYACWLVVAGLLNRWLGAGVASLAATQEGGVSAELRQLIRGAWMPVIIGAVAIGGALVQPAFGLVALMVSPLFMLVFQRFTRPRPAAAPAGNP
jgi:uncharacterized membrane protein